MKKLTKKEVILIIIFIVSVVFFNIKEFRVKMNEKLVINEKLNENDTRESQEKDMMNEDNSLKDTSNKIVEPLEIKVDICGAVQKPGVITLKEGDRLEDAIRKAGGLTEKADIFRINRSEIIYDGKKIIIPEVGQDINIELIGTMSTLEKDNKININIASKKELMKLDGVGESISKRIIKYRQENKGFKSIEDIMNVSGIGESKFEHIKDSIKVK